MCVFMLFMSNAIAFQHDVYFAAKKKKQEGAPGGEKHGEQEAAQLPTKLREIYLRDLHPARLFAALLFEV